MGEDREPRRVELMRGRRRAPAGNTVGLLDEHDRQAGVVRSACRGHEVTRRDAAARAVTEYKRGARIVDRLHLRARRPVRCLDLHHVGSL